MSWMRPPPTGRAYTKRRPSVCVTCGWEGVPTFVAGEAQPECPRHGCKGTIRERENFPAPRENDCSYGCCKAGDVGLTSELVRAA